MYILHELQECSSAENFVVQIDAYLMPGLVLRHGDHLHEGYYNQDANIAVFVRDDYCYYYKS